MLSLCLHSTPTEEINVPRRTTDIVDDLGERLRLSGRPYMTIPWPDFYKLCGRERLKQPFLDDVEKEALNGRHQLAVAYGNNAVVICYDQNFADFQQRTRATLPDEF